VPLQAATEWPSRITAAGSVANPKELLETMLSTTVAVDAPFKKMPTFPLLIVVA